MASRMRTLIVVLSVLVSSPGWCWGVKGHRAVAFEAQGLLTPAAQAEVERLLSLEGARNLAEVSTWADEVKGQGGAEGPMHTVRLPLDHSPYDPNSINCTRHECLVKAIQADLAVLGDRSKPDQDRLTALKYVVHFVAEIHQPLHASADKGRQWVIYRGKPVIMHKVWDTSLLVTQERNPKRLAERLMANAPAVEAARARSNAIDPAAWAEESRDVARDFIFSGPYGIDRREGRRRGEAQPLSDDYYEKAMPIVEERLRLAGLRLATTLNKTLR